MKKFKWVLVVGTATTMLFGSALNVSAAELRDIFDAKYYADSYADLKEVFGYDESQLYNHFITCGLKEGRNMSPILNVVAYRNAYGDLSTAFGDNWDAYVNHFIASGASEMREYGVLFNPITYAEAYPDIKAAYGDDLLAIIRHYLTFGKAENRTLGTSDGYADMAAARKAKQEVRPVIPNAASSASSDTSDIYDTDDTDNTNDSDSDVPGSDTKIPDKPSVVWDYDGRRIEYEYDKHGNLISQTTYDNEGYKEWSHHYTYNSNDELVRSEMRDGGGNCIGYDEYVYDEGKLQKKTSYYGSGEVSFSETYEWNGNAVKESRYNAEGNLIDYIEYETDSRLNFIREECYTQTGDLYCFYVYTYDENDNMLTKIGYVPDGTEVTNTSFTYYENGTKKTETNIMGNYKEIFEYNENGSRASFKSYSDGVLQEANTYTYYAEGPLANLSYEKSYGGSIEYGEVDYDRQGKRQKETLMSEESDGRKYMTVYECTADGSYTRSAKAYNPDGKLYSKFSETYNAQGSQVNGTYYSFSDGNVESVTVETYDEDGRLMNKSLYEADEVTLISATVCTYVDTEYGYDKTREELAANGSVLSSTTYMCDKNGNNLGSRSPASDGGFVEYWYNGKYKNQHWWYTAEGKLRRKEIRNDFNVTTAVYEYDEDGNEIELVWNDAAGEWVRPSESSGTAGHSSSASGGDAVSISASDGDADSNSASDGDADSNSASDGDADSNSASDGDADSNSASDGGADSNSASDGDADSNSAPDGN